MFKGTISSGNLNSYTEIGIYRINAPNDTTISNFPSGAVSWGTLLVVGGDTYLQQIYLPNYGATWIFMRAYYGSSWQTWHSQNRTS